MSPEAHFVFSQVVGFVIFLFITTMVNLVKPDSIKIEIFTLGYISAAAIQFYLKFMV